jgi:phosphoribosylglycinamide formyltransferase-1
MAGKANTLRERLRKICLALPEAEVASRTGQHDKYTVRGRTFGHFLNDHHGDGRIALNCKVAAGGMDVLIDGDPDRFYPAQYLGPRGWIAMRLDLPKTDWSLAEELVRDSYRMVAPKRLVIMTDNDARLKPGLQSNVRTAARTKKP